MPRITITEKEDTTLALFDSTENTVLVPLFVKPEDSNDTYEPMKFTSVQDFTNIYSTDIVSVIGEEASAKVDKSYYAIYELLLKGLSVVVYPIKVTDNFIEDNESKAEEALALELNDKINNGAFADFVNKNLYNIKFITTGAWKNCWYNITESSESSDSESSESGGSTVEVFGCYNTLVNLAASRGDCVALIELPDESPSKLIEAIITNNVLGNVGDDFKFAAATIPWGKYTLTATSEQQNMPGSFGYLMAYANSVKVNPNWFAAAGILRGSVPCLSSLNYNVTESQMHLLQGDSDAEVPCFINPIMPVGTYGIRVWGNRTMYNPGAAVVKPFSAFLNVRMLLCDIKKQLYHSGLRITFEPNDDIAWIKYKTLNNTLLDQMQSGRGLKYYYWQKIATDEKATLKALLTIRPIEALEDIDVTVYMTDEDVEVEETV